MYSVGCRPFSALSLFCQLKKKSYKTTHSISPNKSTSVKKDKRSNGLGEGRATFEIRWHPRETQRSWSFLGGKTDHSCTSVERKTLVLQSSEPSQEHSIWRTVEHILGIRTSVKGELILVLFLVKLKIPKSRLPNLRTARQWWHMPLITALSRQR